MSVIAWLVVGLACLPLWIVIVEVAAALLGSGRRDQRKTDSGTWPSSVVLIPAHNEAGVIGRTLACLLAELPPKSRLLCVAHNCSDDTAEVAKRTGVPVLEARDDGSKGKPAALIAGLRALDADPPDVLVIVDADCTVGPGTLAALIRQVHASGQPAMGSYRFAPGDDSNARSLLSSLAILLKNHVRPLGLRNLGLPCLLHGSGSAYPFQAVRDAPHGEGSIAEDFQLAIDLVERGHPTRFVPEATIYGQLPRRDDNALKQRQRWEHGHLALVIGTAPRLLWRGLVRLDPNRIALALDVGVPPLALTGACFAVVLLLSGALALHTGDSGPLTAAGSTGALFAIALLAAWTRFAGIASTAAALAAIPRYLFWKLPIYLRFATRREMVWKKTERD